MNTNTSPKPNGKTPAQPEIVLPRKTTKRIPQRKEWTWDGEKLGEGVLGLGLGLIPFW